MFVALHLSASAPWRRCLRFGSHSGTRGRKGRRLSIGPYMDVHSVSLSYMYCILKARGRPYFEFGVAARYDPAPVSLPPPPPPTCPFGPLEYPYPPNRAGDRLTGLFLLSPPLYESNRPDDDRGSRWWRFELGNLVSAVVS